MTTDTTQTAAASPPPESLGMIPMPIPFYSDGLCTIYCGDSLEILPLLEADVMVTDPPYGYAYASNKGGRLGGDEIANDRDVSMRDHLLDAWGDRPALAFGSWKRPRPSGIVNVLVWDKGDQPGMGDLKLPWGHSHEEIYVIGRGFAGKRTGSVLRYNRVPQGAMHHQNEKPLALMRDLISKTHHDAVIIDPFMGSGSTLRAAKDLGRHCIGIELDERWCAVAAKRLAQESLVVERHIPAAAAVAPATMQLDIPDNRPSRPVPDDVADLF